MDLIMLVLLLALVGFCVWLFTTKIPMPPSWASTIQVIALILLILYVITRFFRIPNVLP